MGFTCSKKVGNAVARNRAKRRLREARALVLPELGRPGWDYVLIGRARRDSRDVPFAALQHDLRDALRKLHSMTPAGACRRPARARLPADLFSPGSVTAAAFTPPARPMRSRRWNGTARFTGSWLTAAPHRALPSLGRLGHRQRA